MGVAIPQVITPSRATGAQVIDGSLKFDTSIDHYLTRTPSSDGNRKTWTLSAWIRRGDQGTERRLFNAASATDSSSTNPRTELGVGGDGEVRLYLNNSGSSWDLFKTSALLRDTGWYHLVIACDTTQTGATNQKKIYINGVLQTDLGANAATTEDADTPFNKSGYPHHIGAYSNTPTENSWDGNISQMYWIDGQQLGPENFGFTDPLTNTWKPKKFSGSFTNSSPNDGTTWSGQVTGSFYGGSYDETEMFDGSLSSVAQSTGATWTTNIPFTTLRIYGQIYGAGTRSISVNGTDVTSQLGSDGDARAWHTITGVSSPLTSIQWDGTSYVGATPDLIGLSAIEIDGTILVDGANYTGVNSFYLPFDGNSPIGQDQSGNGNDFTPVRFGGSLELDNPQVSGARPILNTTQGGTQAAIGAFGSKENKTVTVTVASKTGGGNAYFFDSVERDSLATIRGSTITFDTTDSTNNSHPFKLSSTNADSSGGTEYTDGVAYYINGSVTTGSDYVTNYSTGAASGFRGIKWTVPHNVSTTYYYCTVHDGMGENGRLTSTTDETKADPYAWKCVLACPLVGGNVDVSNEINCTSTTKVMTDVGNAAASSANSNFYSGSFVFDGTGDGITTPDNTDFEFGSGDFTVECWVRQDDTSGFDQFVGKYGGSGDGEYIVGKNGNTPTFYWQDSGGNNNIDATNFRGNTDHWYHMACVREGNAFTMYINGICENSTTDSTTLNATSNKLTIGIENDESSSAFDGYLQDVRIYKGVAKYSGTTVGTQYFVPPSTSPDILPDTPSGVSGNSKLTKITDGAVSFDGSGDYLSMSESDFTNISSSDAFTIEAFVYLNDLDAYSTVFASSNSSFSTGGFKLEIYNSKVRVQADSLDLNSGMTLSTKRWYHLAFSRTSDGKAYSFVDGILDNSATSKTFEVTWPVSVRIGGKANDTEYLNGFVSNFRYVDGTALYTSRFTPPTAPLTNVTNTELLCCQSNTSTTAAAATPGSINTNGNAAATNFNPFITDINAVRGQETGQVTLNPLSTGEATLTNGNLDYSSSSNMHTVTSTISVSSGKWYWENQRVSGGTHYYVGIADIDTPVYGNWTGSNSGYSWSVNTSGSICHNNAEGGALGSVSSIAGSDKVVGWALDMDEGTLVIYANGKPVIPSSISSPNPKNANSIVSTTDLAGRRISPAHGHSSHRNMRYNFGQKPFKYAPPDGFQPLNAANLRPETVISRPDQYVGVSTWSGDSSERQIVTGNAPDFVWIKADADDEHVLADSVRGGGAVMSSSSQSKQADFSNPGHWGSVKSFDDSGFTVQTGAGGYHRVNLSGRDYSAWCWKAGGSKNTFNVDNVGYSTYTTAPGLNAGTIKIAAASVGTKQGFSIIKYTGNSTANATLPHGLSEAPNFVIIRNMSNDYGWAVLHTEAGTTGTTLDGSPEYYMLQLDSAASIQDFSEDTIWNPTSTTVKIDQTGGANWVNNSNSEYIAYLWHDVPGLQKFGKYKGNGDADGPYVELGFRPAAVIVKYAATSGSASWFMYNSKRGKFNPNNDTTMPDRTAANQQAYDIDFLSNGFKLRYADSAGYTNYDAEYVYMAWAESPTVDLYGGGANAR